MWLRLLQYVVLVVCLLIGVVFVWVALSQGEKDTRVDPDWMSIWCAVLFFAFAIVTAYAMRGTRRY